MADRYSKITVLADDKLAEALRAEQRRLEREMGLRASLSSTAVMILRRGLEGGGEAA
jgi:hypothetical protein